MNTSPDVAIIGAGIAGGSLATVLARAGLSVVLLEKTAVHKDVVRGEWMSPWGVREARELGLLDLYDQAGGHRIVRHIGYNEFVSHAEAEAQTIPLQDVAGDQPLCLGHPRCCDLLDEAAVQAGAIFIREIKSLKVTSDVQPEVEFVVGDEHVRLTPRLIVGADGRNGVVAKQIGCTLTQDEEHHLFSGMLVENADDWPEDLQVIATEGDANVLAFPQGEGRVRVYLGWPSEDRTRLLGPDGPRRFLDSWQLQCVPRSDAIVGATPVSPCIAYPNSDAWVDHPVREGVVLIGDAAGRNDPIIGQGLSITHRDVRLVRDALLGNKKWDTRMFDDYVEERRDRMARLRVCARLTSLRESAFGPEGYQLRQEIHHRIAAGPDLAAPFAAAFIGPEALPAEVFTPDFTQQIVGQDIWAPLP